MQDLVSFTDCDDHCFWSKMNRIANPKHCMLVAGLINHIEDNKRVFSFALDDQDKTAIGAIQSKSRDLMKVFGDCGGEYRRRS